MRHWMGIGLSAITALTLSTGATAGSLRTAAREARPIPLASQPRDSAAVRQFAQKFLDWYTPFVQTNPRFPAWWHILSVAPGYLDADLAAALRADSAAQRIQPVSREVIDFDPFLHSQDPCPRYGVTRIRPVAGGYRVSVRPVCPNASWQHWQTSEPSPVLQVIGSAGHWKIANVYYGESDLKSMLCRYAKADARPDRRPTKCY